MLGDLYFGPTWIIQVILDRLGHFGPHLITLDHLAPKIWSPYKALNFFGNFLGYPVH